MQDVFIFDCIRTPRGKAKKSGGLYEAAPHQLVASLLQALSVRNPKAEQATDLILGCVTPVSDQGYNIAQASLLQASWPDHVAASQVNRYCASGLESMHSGAARIAAGWESLLVAGGVESMSRVPLGSDGGAILSNPQLILEHSAIPQGISADLLASLYDISRDEVDSYALRSQQLAHQAQKSGAFQKSIIPILDENGIPLLDKDEHPRPNTTLEGLNKLSPAFKALGKTGFDDLALRKYPNIAKVNHVHTAGNSSGLVDGASLVLIGDKSAQEKLGLKPRAKVRSIAIASSEPTKMLTGMIPATEKALKQAKMQITDLDLIEINEAFAVVPLLFMKHFGIDQNNINVNGGAIALGHPVGATGAMLVGTVVDELERRNLSTGLVTLCAGGGQGIALIVEMI